MRYTVFHYTTLPRKKEEGNEKRKTQSYSIDLFNIIKVTSITQTLSSLEYPQKLQWIDSLRRCRRSSFGLKA
jgi:hypothetical protein